MVVGKKQKTGGRGSSKGSQGGVVVQGLSGVESLEQRVLQAAQDAVVEEEELRNDIKTLLSTAKAQDCTTALAAVSALCHVFLELLSNTGTQYTQSGPKRKGARLNAHYNCMLRTDDALFVLFKHTLLLLIGEGDNSLQIPLLEAYMRIIKREAEVDAAALESPPAMPFEAIEPLVKIFTSNLVGIDGVVEAFGEKYVSEFDDVRFHTMVALSNVMTAKKGMLREESEGLARRVFEILPYLSSLATTEDDLSTFLVGGRVPVQGSDAGKMHAPVSVNVWKDHKRAFSDCWLHFLQLYLPQDIYKDVLSKIDSHIIPHMPQPLLLVDFLTQSYDSGGVNSMLSLAGLFILITRHNLDYPDFFKKLYSLLQPNLFHVKYRQKFFKLLDHFLSAGSRLPAYLVAGFAKRLCRLALNAPPEGCLVAMAVTYKLMQRHFGIRHLIHKVCKREVPKQALLIGSKPEDFVDASQPLDTAVGFDPYNHEELDPAKCNAIKSSLWEITSLRQHYYPSVSQFVNIFEGDFTQKHDVEEQFSRSYQTMFFADISKKTKKGTVAVVNTFSSLFEPEEFGQWQF